MKEQRYLPPITGCHECEENYTAIMLKKVHCTGCDENIDVIENVKSKTFHPDCPLTKSIVKPLDELWKFGYWDEFREENLKSSGRHEIGSAYIKDLSIIYRIVETDKGDIIALVEKGDAGDEYVKDKCKSKEEAKAEAEKHWQEMIMNCLK